MFHGNLTMLPSKIYSIFLEASSTLGILVHREFKAIAGAVTISFLMVCSISVSACAAKRMHAIIT